MAHLNSFSHFKYQAQWYPDEALENDPHVRRSPLSWHSPKTSSTRTCSDERGRVVEGKPAKKTHLFLPRFGRFGLNFQIPGYIWVPPEIHPLKHSGRGMQESLFLWHCFMPCPCRFVTRLSSKSRSEANTSFLE